MLLLQMHYCCSRCTTAAPDALLLLLLGLLKLQMLQLLPLPLLLPLVLLGAKQQPGCHISVIVLSSISHQEDLFFVKKTDRLLQTSCGFRESTVKRQDIYRRM
jgi:hypothetical protein